MVGAVNGARHSRCWPTAPGQKHSCPGRRASGTQPYHRTRPRALSGSLVRARGFLVGGVGQVVGQPGGGRGPVGDCAPLSQPGGLCGDSTFCGALPFCHVVVGRGADLHLGPGSVAVADTRGADRGQFRRWRRSHAHYDRSTSVRHSPGRSRVHDSATHVLHAGAWRLGLYLQVHAGPGTSGASGGTRTARAFRVPAATERKGDQGE